MKGFGSYRLSFNSSARALFTTSRNSIFAGFRFTKKGSIAVIESPRTSALRVRMVETQGKLVLYRVPLILLRILFTSSHKSAEH